MGVLLLLTLAFKILYQLDLDANDPVAQHPVSDEKLIIQRAVEIAGGTLAPDGVYHTAPLYPYLLAPVFKICGQDYMAPRLLQALLGTLSVLLLYLTARMFFPRSWALVSAAAMVLYYPMTFFEGKLLITTSATFFSLLALFFLSQHRGTFGAGRTLAAGLAVGIASALRPNLILWVPLLLPWFLWSFKGREGFLRGALFILVALIPILPFTIHNYLAEDDWVLLSDNGGINFYLGNNPESRGSFHTTDPHWGDQENQFAVSKDLAESARGKSLKSSEVSAYWMDHGFAFIKDKPLDYLLLLARKMKSFLENFEYAILYAPQAERTLTPSLRVAFIPWAVFVAAAALGLFFIRTRNPDEGDPAMNPWFPGLLLVVVVILSVLLFFNYSRFRLPALPVFILLGVHGIRSWIRALGHRSWPGVLTGAGVLATFLALSLIHWGDQWMLQKAHGLSTVGTALAMNGDLAGGEKFLDMALEDNPDLDLIIAQRGSIRQESGDFAGAREDFLRAVELKPHIPYNLANLASFYSKRTPYRDLDQALDLIQQATRKPLETPHLQAFVLRTEGNIRMEREEFKTAADLYQTAFSFTPGDSDLLFAAAYAARLAGDVETARTLLSHLLQLDPNHRKARIELNRLR